MSPQIGFERLKTPSGSSPQARRLPAPRSARSYSVIVFGRKCLSGWACALRASFTEGGAPPGDLPIGACELERPCYPHLSMTDATIEILGYNQAGLPKGFQLQCDELSGWIGSFGRYNKGKPGSDTAFWLGAYDGRPHKVDRVH